MYDIAKHIKVWQISKYNFLLLLFTIMSFSLTSCDIIEYSPYETDIPAYKSNDKYAEIINSLPENRNSSFKFALISDSHLEYSSLKNAVAALNSNDSISFVIHVGDFTNSGLKSEFEKFYSIISKLNKPFIVCIGNHDCIANGQSLYNKMFGNYSVCLKYKRTTIFTINDNLWDFNGNPIVNNYKQLLEDTSIIHKIFVAHIPPYGDQFSADAAKKYNDSIAKYGVEWSIHGHTHSFFYSNNFYGNGVKYLTVPAITDKSYILVSVAPDSISFTRREF